jgi:hypothetical protein
MQKRPDAVGPWLRSDLHMIHPLAVLFLSWDKEIVLMYTRNLYQITPIVNITHLKTTSHFVGI